MNKNKILARRCIGLAAILGLSVGLTDHVQAQANYAKAVDTFGLYYPNRGEFYLQDSDGSGVVKRVSITGVATSDLPFAGDWIGSGFDSVGLYDRSNSTFYLKNDTVSSGSANLAVQFGWANTTAYPIAGDWTHKGYDSIGFYVPETGTFYLKNSNTGGAADLTLPVRTNTGAMPPSDAVPAAGDWVGDGICRVGFSSPNSGGYFYVRMTNDPSQPNCAAYWTGGGGAVLGGKWLTTSTAAGRAVYYSDNYSFGGTYSLAGGNGFYFTFAPQGRNLATPPLPLAGKWQPSKSLAAGQNTSCASPSWMKDQIMYQMRIDTFTDAASSGTNTPGTFKAATGMLPQLADLGITGIVLNPVEANGQGGDIRTNNYYGNCVPGTLEPRLGTDADFANFVTQAHALGMKVYVDIVEHGLDRGANSPYATGPNAFPFDYLSRNADGSIVINYWTCYELDWTSQGLRDWYTNNVGIAWVNKYGLDGFRMDLEPAPANSPLWSQFKSQILATTGKQIVLIPETPQIPRAYLYDTTQNDFMISTSAGTLVNWATKGNAGNIVDAVKNCPENFYTSGLSSHDSRVYGAQGKPSRFAYGMLLSPFIPRWFMGEEFNAIPDLVLGGSDIPLYFSQLHWSQQTTGSNNVFYNQVKQLIRIRKAYNNAIVPNGVPLNQANLTKVATYSGVDLPPYTMWGGSNSITVLASNASATGTASAVVPIDQIGLSAYPYFQVADLLSNSMTIKSRANVLSGLSYPINQGGVVPLLVAGVNQTQVDQLWDNFNYVAGDINNHSPAIGVGAWSTQYYYATDSISANGSKAVINVNGGVPGASGGVANYPFTPSPNSLYTLTINFEFTGTTGSDCWAGFGFSTITGGGNNSGNVQGPWMLIRPQGSPGSNGGAAGFYGDASHGAGGWSVLASCYPNLNATITFNTQTNVAQYYIQGVLQGSVTLTAPQINYLFFQSFQTGNLMNVKSVRLTVQPTSICPAIIGQLASQTVAAGQSVNFTVSPAGVPAPACQWQRKPNGSGTWSNLSDGGGYAGTQTATLSINPVALAMNGDQFQCMASNGVPSDVTSNAATMTVEAAYAHWSKNYFTTQQLADPTISGAAAMPQKDGMANGLKYFFDVDPSKPVKAGDRSTLMTAGNETIGAKNYLTLVYRQNPAAYGVTPEVQTCNLQGDPWQTVTPDITESAGTDPVTGDPMVRVKVDVTGNSRKFARLKVVVP